MPCLVISTDPPWIVVHRHTAPYPNESSTKSLGAYGPSFGGNESSKSLPHCQNLYTSPSLVISEIVQAKSPLSSLSPPRYGDIVALFCEKLDMGNLSVLVQNPRCVSKSNSRFATMYPAP